MDLKLSLHRAEALTTTIVPNRMPKFEHLELLAKIITIFVDNLPLCKIEICEFACK